MARSAVRNSARDSRRQSYPHQGSSTLPRANLVVNIPNRYPFVDRIGKHDGPAQLMQYAEVASGTVTFYHPAITGTETLTSEGDAPVSVVAGGIEVGVGKAWSIKDSAGHHWSHCAALSATSVVMWDVSGLGDHLVAEGLAEAVVTALCSSTRDPLVGTDYLDTIGWLDVANSMFRQDDSYLSIAPSDGMTIKRISATSYLLLKQIGTQNLYQGCLIANATAYIDDLGVYAKATTTRTISRERVGTWTYVSGISGAYGGSYWRTNIVGNYCEFAVAGHTIGFRGVRTTVGGFTKVAIDGDDTLANLLPDAQYLVDRGVMESSCLAGNGGTLQPTDKILDQYWSATEYDWTVAISTGLANVSHTIRLTCTGYKRAASADTRLMVNAYFIPSIDGELLRLATFTDGFASAFELAAKVTPTGYTSEFAGTVHLNETLTSIIPYKDGSLVSMSDGDTLTGDVMLKRLSTLLNASYGGSVANVSIDYKSGQNSINVTTSISWLVNGNAMVYRGMLPGKEYLDRFSSADSIYDILANKQDYSYVNAMYSSSFYGISHDGFVSISTPHHGYVEDRGDGKFYNKIYISISQNSVSYTENISNGGATEFTVDYRCNIVPMKKKPLRADLLVTKESLSGPVKNNITRLSGASITIDPAGTYQLADTNAWRVVTGWTAGTANDFFDANGVPITFTGQQLIDSGIGYQLYHGQKGVAGYAIEQDAKSHKKIVKFLRVNTYLDSVLYDPDQDYNW